MANVNDNELDTIVSDADQALLTTASGDMMTVLNNYTKSLTDEQRGSYFSINVGNLVFATEAGSQGAANSGLLPAPVQTLVTRLQKDVKLYNQLNDFEELFLAQVNIRVKDTKRIAAHEAYVSALAIYRIFEALHTMGVEGATAPYLALKERFANQGGPGPDVTP